MATLTAPALVAARKPLARLFLGVLIARAACDPLFELIKPEAGGGMGLGAAVNAFMLAVAGLFALRRPRAVLGAAVPMWLAFLLAAALSTVLAPVFSSAARLFLVQLSYCALFAIPFFLVRGAADVRPCLYAVLTSSVVPVVFALVQLAMQGGIGSGEEGRLRATFSHPNIFAFYLVLMLSMILYLQKAAGPPRRPRALWLYAALLLALLVCTKTRSAWAGALLVFVLYGLFFQRRYLLYALLVPALLMLDPAVRDRVTELGVPSSDTPGATNLNSYAWRVLLWKAGLQWMDASHTVFGYGLDAFKHYSPRFFPLEGQDEWDPHNVYVQLLFETGMVGLAAYAWLFWRLIRHLWRGIARDRPGSLILLATVLSYLLTSYSDNMLYYLSYNWYFWFFMGSACAAIAAQRRGVVDVSLERPCAIKLA